MRDYVMTRREFKFIIKLSSDHFCRGGIYYEADSRQSQGTGVYQRG